MDMKTTNDVAVDRNNVVNMNIISRFPHFRSFFVNPFYLVKICPFWSSFFFV